MQMNRLMPYFEWFPIFFNIDKSNIEQLHQTTFDNMSKSHKRHDNKNKGVRLDDEMEIYRKK